MKRILLAIFLLATINTAYSGVYKWVDEKGKIHFSDKKPAHLDSTSVDVTPSNIIDSQDISSKAQPSPYVKDKFRMPYRVSKVPYRFVMTSAMNVDEPTDRLSSIKITLKQKSFYSYIKLTGIEAGVNYTLRVRAIDDKGELVFDKDRTINSQSNSAWFSVRVSPTINIDEPGIWTIQGILNNEKLFVETRSVNF